MPWRILSAIQRGHFSMRALIVPAILAGSMLLIVASAMTVASSLMESHASHKFGTDSAPLWTMDPVRVDKPAQNYERLPSAVAYVEQTSPRNVVVQNVPSAQNTLIPSDVNREALNWCHARYRSYNDADNSYQPSTGGQRRQCQVPIAAPQQIAQASPDCQIATGDDHARRCAVRYSSYRSSDNTYQPYGGTRCVCTLDGNRSSSNLQALRMVRRST